MERVLHIKFHLEGLKESTLEQEVGHPSIYQKVHLKNKIKEMFRLAYWSIPDLAAVEEWDVPSSLSIFLRVEGK